MCVGGALLLQVTFCAFLASAVLCCKRKKKSCFRTHQMCGGGVKLAASWLGYVEAASLDSSSSLFIASPLFGFIFLLLLLFMLFLSTCFEILELEGTDGCTGMKRRGSLAALNLGAEPHSPAPIGTTVV